MVVGGHIANLAENAIEKLLVLVAMT